MSYRTLLIIIIIWSYIFQWSILYSQTFSISEPPKNLGAPVNSPENDFAPTVSPDGSYIIFNSNRNGKYQDLFISHFRDGSWSSPEPLTQLNSPYNDETPFLTSDGTTLLFSSDRDGSIEMPKNEENQIRVSFDLYWSKKTNGNWGVPVPVPGNVNSINHEKTPSLNKNGNNLYYCSWLFGDMNRIALIQADFKNGSFINPRPMPSPFNSGNSDIALVPAEDQGGFFFASNRPNGFGMFDIYFVEYKNGKFGPPVNLGDKINSPASELYLSRADQRFYICSNREGGAGLFDIYSSFVFKKEARFETRAIMFDFNQAVIQKESFPYLDALTAFLKENVLLNIEIIGHTDLIGTDEYNMKLSIDRAEAVKKFLIGKGLDERRFKIIGAGKKHPVVKKIGNGFDELNRRTEFRILK